MESKQTKQESAKVNTLFKVTIMTLILTVMVVGFLFYQLVKNDDFSTGSVSSVFEKEKVEEIYPLEEFTVKLSDGHYAKLSVHVGVMYQNDDELDKLGNSKPILRDNLIIELMKLTEEDFQSTTIQNTKLQLQNSLQTLIPTIEFTQLYFDNLVVQ